MKINYSLALAIRDNYGDEHFSNKNNVNCFTNEELSKITELTIQNCNSLVDIDKLPNLKKLNIISDDYINFATYIDLENNPLINQIKDFTPLEKLSNLVELSIVNDIHIRKLNLQNMTNLKKITLLNNPSLNIIKNLEKLSKLEYVKIYGCNVKNIIDFGDYIINTINVETNILDINMYSSFVKDFPKNSQSLSNLYKLGFTNIMFAEKTGFADYALLTPEKVNSLFQICYKFIYEEQIRKLSDYDKIKTIYKYVTKNVEFDSEGITKRDKEYIETNIKNGNIPPHLRNNFSMLHSSYNAGVLKMANCEGYVNLMNFMLRMLNIECATVYATNKGNPNVASYNHALTSVKIDGKWYYFEPTWEKPNEFKYFMKTYEEIQKTHILSPLELLKNKEVNENVNFDGTNYKFK